MGLQKRHRITAAGTGLAVLVLSGCGPSPQAGAPLPGNAPPSAPGTAAGTSLGAPRYTLDTPVDRIAADPRGRAILRRDVPGLLTSSSYIMIEDMSLTQIASLSNGRLTQQKLDRLQADLTALSTASP